MAKSTMARTACSLMLSGALVLGGAGAVLGATAMAPAEGVGAVGVEQAQAKAKVADFKINKGVNYKVSKKSFTSTWKKKIDKFYSKYAKKAPLKKHSKAIAEAAYKYKVDPRLIVSIAQIETLGGKYVNKGTYNAWNWYSSKVGDDLGSSWDKGVNRFAKEFKANKFGISKCKTVSSLAKFYSSRPALWQKDVVYFMKKF